MMVMMMMMMSAVFTAMLTTTAWSPRRWSVDDLGGVGRVVTCWWCCRYMTSATLRRPIVSSGLSGSPRGPEGRRLALQRYVWRKLIGFDDTLTTTQGDHGHNQDPMKQALNSALHSLRNA